MITPDIFKLAEAIQHDRLARAAARHATTSAAAGTPAIDRLRLAIGARLIAWGQQLQPPARPAARTR
ncbi:hypothetical protein [Kouleothrix sp.]|uniref:hypothetical protein n=1 Tax=Kouleothrix sp. TaxID=2779161 RepID=UPI00391CAC14